MSTDRLASVTLHEERPPARSPDQQQEIDVALFDLAEENAFRLPSGAAGPHALALSFTDRKLVFELNGGAESFHVPLSPFRALLADYAAVCAQYVEAVRTLPPARIEAVDLSRKELHDAGSRLLLERLEGKAETDLLTARRLFTLIAALTHRG